MKNERPRKTYNLTTDGQNLLNFTENSLNFICKKISTTTSNNITVELSNQTPSMMKKIRTQKPLI
jgi:DNA-binding PadR family transcriptional regulator